MREELKARSEGKVTGPSVASDGYDCRPYSLKILPRGYKLVSRQLLV
jgi:hypothetical protein